MDKQASQVSAIILAGGASQRMGRDKWALPWPAPGRADSAWTQLSEILFKLKDISENTVIVCSPSQEQDVENSLSNYGWLENKVHITCDQVQYQGPLYGLLEGMRKLAEVDHHQWTFVTSCDAPLLNPAIINILLQKVSKNLEAIIPRDEEHVYPLCGLYKRGIQPHLEELINQGHRKLMLLLDQLQTCYLSTEEFREVDPDLRSLLNLNEPEVYNYWFTQMTQGNHLTEI